MSNLLTEPRATMPLSLVAGDSLRVDYVDMAATYPAADGYSVTFAFVSLRGGSASEVPATDGVLAWSLFLPVSMTETWTVGEWRWAAKVEHGAERLTVASGTIKVLPDPASTADARSHARRVLDSLEAAIEGRATQTDLENTLADGRQIKRMSHKELLDMRDAYAKKVAGEDRRNGRSGPSRVLVSL